MGRLTTKIISIKWHKGRGQETRGREGINKVNKN
jgi:hypothetical protein